jgi:hypothetical protein
MCLCLGLPEEDEDGQTQWWYKKGYSSFQKERKAMTNLEEKELTNGQR